jgi:uncharacterized protein (TIGR00661 family)
VIFDQYNYASIIPLRRRERIFYAIQATGNGHIARALELMPWLKQYGDVDVFLSGSNSNLTFDLPVKYRSKGLSLFYGNRGGLDYYKMWRELNIQRIWNEAKQLPVEKYDIVVNDFESITSLACWLKKIPSISIGHQASFQSSKVPRPAAKNIISEFVLRNYAKASAYIGLHFEQYDDFIFNPILKKEIRDAEPTDKGYITVYLSHYPDEVVAKHLKLLSDTKFEIFSKKVRSVIVEGNITFIPISNKAFNKSLINCSGVITGAGFETPAEALYLGKKLLCVPIKGQYEQLCNAAALERFNVPLIPSVDKNFSSSIVSGLGEGSPKPLHLTHSTYEIVQHAMETARSISRSSIDPDVVLNNKNFIFQ